MPPAAAAASRSRCKADESSTTPFPTTPKSFALKLGTGLEVDVIPGGGESDASGFRLGVALDPSTASTQPVVTAAVKPPMPKRTAARREIREESFVGISQSCTKESTKRNRKEETLTLGTTDG